MFQVHILHAPLVKETAKIVFVVELLIVYGSSSIND